MAVVARSLVSTQNAVLVNDGSILSASCMGDETVAEFVEGRIAPQALAAIEDHLANCSACCATVAFAADASSPLAAAPREEPPGDDTLLAGSVLGRYVVERLVGRGAMGAVYAARDPDLDRRVAVKLLRASALSTAARSEMRARLLREAQAMARLSHPEVIAVYDVGALGEQLFIAMEFVEGSTLRQWAATRHRSWRDLLAVYERAGSGLAAAHAAGLVHRDFKPDNVLIGDDGRVRVTDFGLARALMSAEAHGNPTRPMEIAGERAVVILTRTGRLLGTPAYMPPEQLRGRRADARSDVFSYCVSLYEALYGERPFDGSTTDALETAILERRVRGAPVMTRVPRWLRAVLLRGLRPAPEERFASMRALLDDLRRAHAQSRRRILGAAAGALAVTLVGTTGLRHALPQREAPSVIRTVLAEPATLPPPPALPPPSLEPAPLQPALTAAETKARAPRPSLLLSTPKPAPSTVETSHKALETLSAPGPRAAVPMVGNNGALILE